VAESTIALAGNVVSTVRFSVFNGSHSSGASRCSVDVSDFKVVEWVVLRDATVGVIDLGLVRLTGSTGIYISGGERIGVTNSEHGLAHTAALGAEDISVLSHCSHLISSAIVMSKLTHSLSSILSTLDVGCVQVTSTSHRVGQSLGAIAFYLSIRVIDGSLFFFNEISSFNCITNLVFRLKRVSVSFALPSLVIHI
jgi:hypothetical protein